MLFPWMICIILIVSADGGGMTFCAIKNDLQKNIAINNKIILKVNVDFNTIDLRKVQFLYFFTNIIIKF